MCMNVFFYLFHIFPTRVFPNTRVGSSPNAYFVHDFEVSNTHVRPKYQPNQGPLSWSFSLSMV